MMRQSRIKTMLVFLSIVGVVAFVLFATSCVKYSGDTWMVKSAPLLVGWPDLTPIGMVEIREYPEYRAAFVTDTDQQLSNEDRTGPMFMELFGHIQKNDIPMTTPVEMGYEDSMSNPRVMTSMAFLYRKSDLGPVGDDGTVAVRDIQRQAFASVGVRGDYHEALLREGLEIVRTWLKDHASEWTPIGPPRFLGYNGPFTPAFMRYGEVQVPVQAMANATPTVEAASAP